MLRGATGLEEVDDALGLWCDFGAAKDAVVRIVGEKGGQSHAADAGGGLLKEVATIDGEGVDGLGNHGRLSDKCCLLNEKCEGSYTDSGSFLEVKVKAFLS